MNRLLILFTLLSLFFITGCGMLGFGEPDLSEKTPEVSDDASATAEDDSAPKAEESEALKDEQHRLVIEAWEEGMFA